MKKSIITLQLSFTFDTSDPAQRDVADSLFNMAEVATAKQKNDTITRETTCEERRTINRYVLIAAHARGVSASAMWMILYHHIAKTLGQHPACISYEKKASTHLDALMEMENGFSTAMAYLLDQINKHSADVV